MIAVWSTKEAESGVKYWQTALTILAALSASLALADDFKTISGKEYKNATITRVEPDGITVKFSGGVVKIPFTELPKEVQQKYHYNSAASQRFAAESAAQINALNAVEDAKTTARQEKGTQDRLLQQISIFAVIKPYQYGKKDTRARIQPYERYWKEPTAYDFDYRMVGKEFTGVIDEDMPDYFERGDITVVTLYRIGHADNSSRDPLFTTSKKKAMQFLQTGSTK